MQVKSIPEWGVYGYTTYVIMFALYFWNIVISK